jgi:hypothetical protein
MYCGKNWNLRIRIKYHASVGETRAIFRCEGFKIRSLRAVDEDDIPSPNLASGLRCGILEI